MIDIFSVLGTLASFVGLYMSWIVLKNTRKIVFLFLIRGTIPEKVYNLQNCHAKIIQELNGNFDKRSENEIFEIISEISANVENIKYKFKQYDEKVFISDLKPKLERFEQAKNSFSSSPTKNGAREIKNILLEITRYTQFFIDDVNWRQTQ